VGGGGPNPPPPLSFFPLFALAVSKLIKHL